MKWLQFILSHSVFVSVCAAGLCYQSFFLLHLPFNHYTGALVFFATLGSYNFYWLISKYHFNPIHYKQFLRQEFSNLCLLFIAAGGFLTCLFYLPGILVYVSAAVICTVLYSVPLWRLNNIAVTRKAGFFKTILLAFTWAYVTVIIPLYPFIALNGKIISLLFTARFFFMFMLCIIFDSRDVQVDKMHGLRSLATDVSRPVLSVITVAALFIYIFTAALLVYHTNQIIQLIPLSISGLLAIILYRMSFQKQGYFFYYFLADGLMLFSSIATFVAGI